MIKMIVTDLDGTLFRSDHKTVSERNLKALRAASERGIKIVISSGRTFSLIKDLAEMIGAVDYIMVSNGAAALDRRGRTVSSNLIEYEIWKEAYDILIKGGVVTEVYVGGQTYLRRDQLEGYSNPAIGVELVNEIRRFLVLCDDVGEKLKGKSAEKLHAIYITKEDFAYYKTAFENRGLSVTSSIPMNMEINVKGVNKGLGLAALCKSLGIDISEVAAFGDEENDVEMLKTAGLSFAMGNASEEVKKAAKKITLTNDDDGVAFEIEKILNQK